MSEKDEDYQIVLTNGTMILTEYDIPEWTSDTTKMYKIMGFDKRALNTSEFSDITIGTIVYCNSNDLIPINVNGTTYLLGKLLDINMILKKTPDDKNIGKLVADKVNTALTDMASNFTA